MDFIYIFIGTFMVTRRVKLLRFWITVFLSLIVTELLFLHLPFIIAFKPMLESNGLFETIPVRFGQLAENVSRDLSLGNASYTNTHVKSTLDSNPSEAYQLQNYFLTANGLPGGFRISFNETSGNFTEFWKSVRSLSANDSLYPKNYDVTQVTGILRRTKITHADLFRKKTSLKFKIRFEGDQSAIFKVMLTGREKKSTRQCNHACEHPEYEVAAFALNRMFDLRNMPYTTGRILSWFDELKPVATPRLKEFIQVQNDTSICLKWNCLRDAIKQYCFKDGMIAGSVTYFIGDKVIKILRSARSQYHGFYIYGIANRSDLTRLPGDKTFCNWLRNGFPYKYDKWFLDLVDIAILDYLMSHLDSKHTAIVPRGKDGPLEFNVMIDYGHAFCRYDKLTHLAPLIQCCKIRTRLFKAMELLKDTFEETFLSLTRDDPLHPLLIPANMYDLKPKLKQILALIDFCRNFDGDRNVFVDV